MNPRTTTRPGAARSVHRLDRSYRPMTERDLEPIFRLLEHQAGRNRQRRRGRVESSTLLLVLVVALLTAILFTLNTRPSDADGSLVAKDAGGPVAGRLQDADVP